MMAISCYLPLSLRYSKVSLGWHSKALQIASKVENRIAFACPFKK